MRIETDSDWRRLHISSVFITKEIVAAIIVAFVGLGYSFLGYDGSTQLFDSNGMNPVFKIVFGLMSACITLWIAKWCRRLLFRYRFYFDRVIVRTGFIRKNDRVIPFERIHGIDTTQTVLQKLCSTTSVQFQTSSGVEVEAELSGIKISEVDELRELVQSYQKNENISSQIDTVDENGLDGEFSKIAQLSMLDCVKLAFIRGRTGIFIALAVAASANYVDDFRALLGDWSPRGSLTDYVSFSVRHEPLPWISLSLNPSADWLAMFTSIGTLLGLFISVLVITSVLISLSVYYRFSLVLSNEVFESVAGLFVQVRKKTPLHRIQMVQVISTMRARLFRRESLRCNTSGVEKDDQVLVAPLSTWLVPLIQTKDVSKVLAVALPGIDFDSGEWESIDPGMVWPRRFKLHLVYIVPLSVLLFMLHTFLVGVLACIVPWAIYSSKKFAQSIHYRVLDNGITFKRGWLKRVWTTIPFEKIQSVQIRQNPFDKKYNCATLSIDSAGNTLGRFVKSSSRIPFMDIRRAQEISKLLVHESTVRKFEW